MPFINIRMENYAVIGWTAMSLLSLGVMARGEDVALTVAAQRSQEGGSPCFCQTYSIWALGSSPEMGRTTSCPDDALVVGAGYRISREE